MEEVWKPVIGYESAYLISNFGRLRSLHNYRHTTDRILKNDITSRGYIRATLADGNGNKVRIMVHRLVAQAFLSNWDAALQVDHIDGNKQNNHVNNLRMCTARENINGEGFFGVELRKQNTRKVTIRAVDRYSLTGAYIDTFESMGAARYATGATLGGIAGCCANIRKSAGGFMWSYANAIKTDKPPRTDMHVRPVCQMSVSGEVISYFIHCVEAAKSVGINHASMIAACARGKHKTAGGFMWKYTTQVVYLEWLNAQNSK